MPQESNQKSKLKRLTRPTKFIVRDH